MPPQQPRTTPQHLSLQVGLLVLDSLALPFRQDAVFQTEAPGNTARVVGLVARELCRMAQARDLAVRGTIEFACVPFHIFAPYTHPDQPTYTYIQVVVTNQLTTKVDDGQFAYQAAPAYAWGGGGGGPPLAPTLGARCRGFLYFGGSSVCLS